MKLLRKVLFLAMAGFFLFSSCVVDGGESEKEDENKTEIVDDNDKKNSENDADNGDDSDSGDETDNEAESDTGSDTNTNSKVGKELYIDLTNKKISEDNSTWTAISSEAVKVLGESIKVSLKDSSLIKIDYTSERQEDAKLYFTGSLSGGVKIQTNGSDGIKTSIYLTDVTINSTDYPCIEITKGGEATVYLSGSNTFTDGRLYGYGYGDSAANCAEGRAKNAEGSDSKGSLYCKGNLTIQEAAAGASLSVTQAYKNCIATKDGLLTIKSGTINLKNYTQTSSGRNGLYGGTGIVIEDGTISFDGKGVVSQSDLRKANGFKTDDQDGTNTTNYIDIKGGNIAINIASGKGLSASNVTISGGKTKIFVTGDEVDDENALSYSCYDADGIIENGTLKYNPKGIEGEVSVAISAGALFVQSSKTGIDTEGKLTISGGNIVVSAAKGPFKYGDAADSAFTVSGSPTILGLGSKKKTKEGLPTSCAIKQITKTFDETSTEALSVEGIVAIRSPLEYKSAVLISKKLADDADESLFVQGAALKESETEFISGTGAYIY